LAYVAAAVAAAGLHAVGAASQWLVVHLLLLGAATNAIVVWSAHFTTTLLRWPPLPVARRLVALNAAVLAVLVGVSIDIPGLIVGAAALLVVVVGGHAAGLVRVSLPRAGDRFAGALRFYWVAAAALLVGIGAGAALAVGNLPTGWQSRLYAAHVQLNVFGWVALSVLGTQFALWPMALRTRISDRTPAAARRALPACAVGLALDCSGALAARAGLMAAGIALFGCGVALCLDPLLRAACGRRPHGPASWMLAAGTCWLLAATAVELAAFLRVTGPAAAAQVHGLVPWLLAGFVAQVLFGALTYLLPAVLGGGPALAKRTAVLLDRAGAARVVSLNLGVALVAVPGPQPVRVAGWALTAMAIVSTGGLSAAAIVRRLLFVWR
jgi:nitrite reductase (NO-forming)